MEMNNMVGYPVPHHHRERERDERRYSLPHGPNAVLPPAASEDLHAWSIYRFVPTSEVCVINRKWINWIVVWRVWFAGSAWSTLFYRPLLCRSKTNVWIRKRNPLCPQRFSGPLTKGSRLEWVFCVLLQCSIIITIFIMPRVPWLHKPFDWKRIGIYLYLHRRRGWQASMWRAKT